MGRQKVELWVGLQLMEERVQGEVSVAWCLEQEQAQGQELELELEQVRGQEQGRGRVRVGGDTEEAVLQVLREV